MENTVWIVFKEISDQYGKEEVVCVCSSEITAKYEQSKIIDCRSRREKFILQ